MALINQTPQQYYDSGDYGNYQFVSLTDIINQFMLIYVGEDKVIPKVKRLDVAFHAQRALAELSFDTFKSFKSIEFTVPNTLQLPLPQDYVNYTRVMWVDRAGIKHPLYPTRNTQNPVIAPLQNDDGDFCLDNINVTTNTSDNSIIIASRQEGILPGMLVQGVPYIPDGAIVDTVTHATSSTTITIIDSTGSNLVPSTAGKTLAKFTNQDGSLITPNNEVYVLDDSDWVVGEFKITADSIGDANNVKVGMLVYNEGFPTGTKVVNVVNTIIHVDQAATTTVTSNQGQVIFVDPDKDTTTWNNYKSKNPSENAHHDFDYDDELYDVNVGGRYGINPEHAQINGNFYIDDVRGLIHFSSNISGNVAVIDYISDGLGTEDEMKVHKFAEEAMYKSIIYSIISGRITMPEYVIQRYKRERFAAIRTAKLRLSNLKLEELTQILRGKSKWIKH